MRATRHLLRTLLALALGAAAAVPAHAKWREASTPHFLVYSEQSAGDLKEFATRLERYDQAIRILRDLPDDPVSPSNRVTVYVLDNVEKVRELAGQKKSADWGIMGFYIPSANGSVAFTPRSTGGNQEWDLSAQSVLLHEYAHHFMMQNFDAAFPAWLIEAYAEFLGTADFERDGSVTIGRPATHRAVGLVLGEGDLPMEKLLTSNQHKLTNAQQDLVYGRGWLLLHYLTFEPDRKGQLADYLKRINQGEDNLAAAKAVFGDLTKLDRDINVYLKRNKFRTWKIAPQQARIGVVSVRQVSPAEEAIMAVRLRSKRGVTLAAAKTLVVEARAAAAPFPSDVAAQTMLAEAEYDAGNYAEAAAAAQRALATDPKAVEALLYLGRARLRLAEATPNNPAVWKEARQPIIAANRLDPDDPEPLILYYESFGAAGEPPPALAAKGLARALELAPHAHHLRMTVAHQHLIDGKAAEARAVLQPVAFAPHGRKMAEAARAIIAKIDSGGAKAALQAAESAAEGEDDSSGN